MVCLQPVSGYYKKLLPRFLHDFMKFYILGVNLAPGLLQKNVATSAWNYAKRYHPLLNQTTLIELILMRLILDKISQLLNLFLQEKMRMIYQDHFPHKDLYIIFSCTHPPNAICFNLLMAIVEPCFLILVHKLYWKSKCLKLTSK